MNELVPVQQLALLNGNPTPTYDQWISLVGEGFYRPDIDFASRWLGREAYTKISWFIICEELVTLLAEQFKGKKVADLGCGSGFLVAVLRQCGVDITGYDNRAQHEFMKEFVDDIILTDYTQADLSAYDVLLVCWPSYTDPSAGKVVSKMRPGQYLYYQGEPQGGCCGDDEFFEQVEESLVYVDETAAALTRLQPTWDGIHDRWEVYYKQEQLVLTPPQHAVE